MFYLVPLITHRKCFYLERRQRDVSTGPLMFSATDRTAARHHVTLFQWHHTDLCSCHTSRWPLSFSLCSICLSWPAAPSSQRWTTSGTTTCASSTTTCPTSEVLWSSQEDGAAPCLYLYIFSLIQEERTTFFPFDTRVGLCTPRPPGDSDTSVCVCRLCFRCRCVETTSAALLCL